MRSNTFSFTMWFPTLMRSTRLFILVLLLINSVQAQLIETERQAEYNKRNYTWPPTKFVPDTPGWSALMKDRFEQIAEISDSTNRYMAYQMTTHAALLCPNFTEYGFGLARAPDNLTKRIQQGIYDGLPTAFPERQLELIMGQHNRCLCSVQIFEMRH
jgi:hypothetical protein